MAKKRTTTMGPNVRTITSQTQPEYQIKQISKYLTYFINSNQILLLPVYDLVLFLAIVLSVLRFTYSDYPFGIFKLFLHDNYSNGKNITIFNLDGINSIVE
jgi:hypothetical protein